MGFRFRKRIGLGSLFRLNFSKSGMSVGIGPPGLNVNFGPTGTRTTIGLPGTGLYWQSQRAWAKPAPEPAAATPPSMPLPTDPRFVAFKPRNVDEQFNPLKPPHDVATVVKGKLAGQPTGYMYGVGYRHLNDGSVEAEFPEGVVRFSTPEEFARELDRCFHIPAEKRDAFEAQSAAYEAQQRSTNAVGGPAESRKTGLYWAFAFATVGAVLIFWMSLPKTASQQTTSPTIADRPSSGPVTTPAQVRPPPSLSVVAGPTNTPIAPSAAPNEAALSTTEVREVQRLLAAAGFNPGLVDGIEGKRTLDAARAFEAKAGLPQSSRLNAELLTRLRSRR